MFHTFLNQMGVQEDQLVFLEPHKVESLVGTTAHGSHDNVGPMEDIADRLYVAGLHARHTNTTRKDNQAAISESVLFDLKGGGELIGKTKIPWLIQLYLNLVMKNAFYSLLHGVLLLNNIFILYIFESFAQIFHRQLFLHFMSDFLKPNISFILYANLEIVTEWPQQPIELLQNMRHLSNSQPRLRKNILRGQCHFTDVVK